MPELKFRYPKDMVSESLLGRSFFASWGRVPKPSRVFMENGILTVSAEGIGSGTVHVPWKHPRLGMILESTETLLPRPLPYHLVKELGRGELGRIARKMYEWQMFGFRPSETLRMKLRQAVSRFATLATQDEFAPGVDREAMDALHALDLLVLDICDEFTDQSLAWRRRNNDRIPILLGIGMTSHTAPDSLFEFGLFSETLTRIFHAVAPTPCWSELEPEPGIYRWDLVEERMNVPSRFQFKLLAGPFLEFTTHALPDWVVARLNEEDFFENAAARFIEAFVERFDYIVDGWILASRFNSHSLPGIPIFRGFSMIRNAAVLLRKHSPEKTIMVGIDQPWGEFGLADEPQFGLVNIAEALMSCPEIDAFLLELNYGFDCHSTYPRDPMSLGSLVDHWSFLGKKVFVSLSIPSSVEWDVVFSGDAPDVCAEWNVESQRLWVQSLVRMLLSKRSVQGILWNSLQDAVTGPDDTKSFASPAPSRSGLFDVDRAPKPVCSALATLREDFIK